MFLIGILATAAVNLSALGQGLEGYYTEEEIRTFQPLGSPDKVVIRRSWYAGDCMRKDEQWQGITIARFDKGRIYILDQTTKTYLEVSTDFLRENASEALLSFGVREGKRGELSFPDDLYIRTEATKEIAHWSCYQVTTNPRYRSPESPYVVIWYSTDVNFPVQVFGDQLKQLFGNSPEVDGLFDRLTRFEGYPVRTEVHTPESVTMTTLFKIERRTGIDPALFEIPEGYNGVELPTQVPGSRLTP